MSAFPSTAAIVRARPFIKIAGGKTQLLGELRAHRPLSFNRYIEPFVGGGAFFFDLHASGLRVATLGDANKELVTTYGAIRDNVERVIDVLKYHEAGYRRGGEKFFYNLRDAEPRKPHEVAARMIALNKTCFNGLYRVNRSGRFNTPHGRYKNPTICDEANLRAVSAAIQHISLMSNDFAVTMNTAQAGDFVYCDSPYWPRGGESYFTAYTADGFSSKDQERLRDEALQLKRRGVHVLLSNADVAPVRKLYASGFEMRRVKAARSINSKADKRGDVGELLIW